MSKKLNIIDAMKMPVGTIFEVFDEDGNKDIYNVKVIEVFGKKDSKKLVVDNRAYIEIVVSDFISNATFIPIQQPASFMEVVESGKKCRVEHELVKDMLLDTDYDDADCYIKNALKTIKNGSYLMLEDMLLVIARFSGVNEIQDIIKNGKWYIESEDKESE
ncbi:hypothetical protein NNC19_07305 [Clostridium sp. SHJSY1]|uniref:hypothetical protein n=1 Tax=Clostridium sp. SHJSY1 TaxID=2942483 RepID=UPI0028763F77|nr:hypothetical protein [Clostridium sp. SHJSY1]MDS0525481.1 hypothetical protein [Clostridium sp. SHJSY1]